jgi:hypothetical protein
MPTVVRSPYPATSGSTSIYGVSGLQWGFSADNESGYSNTDPISTLTDIVGVGNGTVGSVSVPTYRTNQVNSLPAILFVSGSFQFYNLPNRFASLTNGHVYIVASLLADPAASSTQSGLWYMGTDTFATHYPFTDGNIYEMFGTTARKTVGNPATSLTTWHIYEVSTASAAWTAWLNGTSLHTTGTNTVGFPAGPFLGASNFGHYLDGYVAEMIVFDHALSGGDRTTIKSALGTKYNITVV